MNVQTTRQGQGIDLQWTPPKPDLEQYPTDRCKSVAQVLADRIRMYTKTARFEQWIGTFDRTERAVTELLGVARTLYQERRITLEELEQIDTAYREYEQSYDGVDILVVVDGRRSKS